MLTRFINHTIIITVSALIFISCNKGDAGPGGQPFKLSYGSNLIYLKNQATDFIVLPDQATAGTYTAFPEGIELNNITGAINVSKSETGLRYKITHTATNGDTTSVIVLLSGLTFTDKFYKLSENDSIAFPVYNANAANPLPLSGSVFDDGNLANSGGCSVKTNSGQINLAETLRNGVFGNPAQNNAAREFEILYKLNDESGKATNKLKVKIYYYKTMADVDPNLLQTLSDRQSQGVFLQANNSNPFSGTAARTVGISAVAKPRPPCVILIGQ
jgi:hypothetical protein